MTGDIGQEIAQPLLLAEDGQQIIARGPGHQMRLQQGCEIIR